jgi:hypothetical protein
MVGVKLWGNHNNHEWLHNLLAFLIIFAVNPFSLSYICLVR